MALGNSTFTSAGSAVNDLFGYFASKETAAGYEAEAAGYGKAAGLARQNEVFQRSATNVQELQTERQAMKVIGGQIADVAGSGFTEGGTALDLLRDSSSQAAIAKQLIGEQGAIQIDAYEQQAVAYDAQQAAAQAAADAAKTGGIGKLIGGGINAAASIATLFI